MEAPEQQDSLNVFIRALDGADRVVVETKNALGKYDAHYFPAAEILASWSAPTFTEALRCPEVEGLVEAFSALLDRHIVYCGGDDLPFAGDTDKALFEAARAALAAIEKKG